MEKTTQTSKDKSNLTKIAYDKIKEAIIANELKPGLSISGNQLTQIFNMSRTPIREAVQLLANEDFVEMQKGVGFFVKEVTPEELRDICEVRIALECSALRKTIARVSSEQIKEMISRWLSLKEEIQRSGVDENIINRILGLDAATHRFITENGQNQYLSRLLDSIDKKITRIKKLALNPHNALDSIRQHLGVLEAMRDNKLSLAERRLTKHLQYSVSHLGGGIPFIK